MTRKKCPLCSRLSSRLKKFFSRFFGRGVDCQDINQRTYDAKEQRVAQINSAAPDCACEKYRMSHYSPGVVQDSEIIARFVYSPIFFNAKKGEIKPNIFSHVFSAGCSVQRDTIATNKELSALVTKYVSKDSKNSLKGVLLAECHKLRGIKPMGSLNRSLCVYDTADEENPAHGEIGQTQYIVSLEDVNELRSQLFLAFNNENMTKPSQYRNGAVWNSLPQSLQNRQ